MAEENKNETQAAGVVSQDALNKALVQLNDLAKSEKDEKDELLKKAVSGDLTAEENARLISLMQGKGSEQADTLAKSATAQLQPASNPAIGQAVEVSDYLNAFHSSNLKALEVIADAIEKSDAREHDFQVVLAKAVVQIGNLVKSLSDKLDSWSEQEAAPPQGARSAAQATQTKPQPIQKSMAGGAPEGDRLSKAQILDTLEAMHVDSLQKGRGGQAICGEDLNKSIAKYEQTGKMTRSLVDEMQAFRAKSRAAA